MNPTENGVITRIERLPGRPRYRIFVDDSCRFTVEEDVLIKCGIDEWSMGIIPGGWVIEKAPFPGSGYAPGEGPAIPEFKIESQRLPHGAELYRIAADGRETLVAGYDADLRRWTVRLPGAACYRPQ